MSGLPQSDVALLVRTDFSNAGRWTILTRELEIEGDDRFAPDVQCVDDPRFDGFSVQDLKAVHPAAGDGWTVFYVADRRALSEPGFPVLVVRVAGAQDRPFRCRIDRLGEVDANLSLGNLDWDDFVVHVGASGVYEGMDDDSAESEQTALQHDDADDEKSRAVASAARIRADLRQMSSARSRSGSLGDVHVRRLLAAEASRVFDAFGRLDHVLGTGGAGDAPGTSRHGQVDGFRSEGSIIVNADREYIIGRVQAYTSPTSIEIGWSWRRRGSGTTHRAGLPAPSLLRVELAETGQTGSAWTTINLRHSGLPVEWVEDMRAFWTWTLADLPNRWRL